MRLHRLQLHPRHAGPPRRPDHRQPRRPDLRRQPPEPGRRRGRLHRPLRLCPGRHRQRRTGALPVRRPRHRGRGQLRGRNPCGPLHQRRRAVYRHQRGRHADPARRGPLRRRAPLRPRLHRRGLRHARAGREISRGHAAGPQQPLLGQQGRGRHARARRLRNLRLRHGHHPLLQQLRPLPVPGKAHPAHVLPGHGRRAPARLRRRHERARLDLRHGPLSRRGIGPAQGQGRRDLQLRRRRGKAQHRSRAHPP